MTTEEHYAGLTYEEVVDHYSDTVTGICAVRCGNLEDTKDCFQNVFLKLFLTDTAFESVEHLRSWLIRVSITTSIDYVKQYWKKNIFLYGNDKDTGNMIDMLTVPAEKTFSSTESEALDDTDDSPIVKEIFQLPFNYRQVIYLFYVEEYDVNEISELLNIPAGTIKSQLSRGRKLLKKDLESKHLYKGGVLYDVE